MSRLTLEWFDLKKQEGQDLRLKIPVCDVYGRIIDRAFPNLVHIDWRPDSHGTCYTYIKLITPQEQESLNQFLELLKTIRCLTITQHLASHFTNELTEAYALDFNFQQGVQPLSRTEIGHWEKLAKEHQDQQAIAELARRLAEVIRRHPTLARADVIMSMPPRPSSAFHLPIQLVRQIGANLGRPVGLNLTKTEHVKLRTIPIEQKITTLARVFTLGGSVRGKTVLVIDDLYQSGLVAGEVSEIKRRS